MKLVDLLNKANEGYEDNFLSTYFNTETGEFLEDGRGDTLAESMVIELRETFDPNAPDEAQVSCAIAEMQMARCDIDGVINSLIQLEAEVQI